MIDNDHQSEQKNFETVSTSSSEAETENYYQVKFSQKCFLIQKIHF